jgi:hypothetical protein
MKSQENGVAYIIALTELQSAFIVSSCCFSVSLKLDKDRLVFIILFELHFFLNLGTEGSTKTLQPTLERTVTCCHTD